MSYLKKLTLPQQQQQLREFIDERLQNEDPKVKEQIERWLNNNQYFADNELFDFYFCVAQNIAAVEVLGGSGEKIVKAKTELEESAEVYTTEIVNTSNWISEKLETQLQSVQSNQQKLDIKLVEVLEGLTTERRNLQTVSTGLVNSTSVLLKKQKQLLLQAEIAKKSAFISVMIAWVIPLITLLGLGLCLILFNQN